MKKQLTPTRLIILLIASLPFNNIIKAQTISKENFQLARPVAKLNYIPYTLNDFSKSSAGKTESDLLTLPNGKKVTMKEYLKTINYVEKNLSDLGYSKDRSENLIVLSKFKSSAPDLVEFSAATKAPLAKTSLASRFTIASTPTLQPILVSRIDPVKPTLALIPTNCRMIRSAAVKNLISQNSKWQGMVSRSTRILP